MMMIMRMVMIMIMIIMVIIRYPPFPGQDYHDDDEMCYYEDDINFNKD